MHHYFNCNFFYGPFFIFFRNQAWSLLHSHPTPSRLSLASNVLWQFWKLFLCQPSMFSNYQPLVSLAWGISVWCKRLIWILQNVLIFDCCHGYDASLSNGPYIFLLFSIEGYMVLLENLCRIMFAAYPRQH